MSKTIFGLILGAILGALDGLSSLLYPEVTLSQLPAIVFFSSLKGLLAGFIIGFYARKVSSLSKGIIFGGAVGLILAFIIAAMPDESGNYYFVEIMIPGTIVGLILGYATQRFGTRETA